MRANPPYILHVRHRKSSWMIVAFCNEMRIAKERKYHKNMYLSCIEKLLPMTCHYHVYVYVSMYVCMYINIRQSPIPRVCRGDCNPKRLYSNPPFSFVISHFVNPPPLLFLAAAIFAVFFPVSFDLPFIVRSLARKSNSRCRSRATA